MATQPKPEAQRPTISIDSQGRVLTRPLIYNNEHVYFEVNFADHKGEVCLVTLTTTFMKGGKPDPPPGTIIIHDR